MRVRLVLATATVLALAACTQTSSAVPSSVPGTTEDTATDASVVVPGTIEDTAEDTATDAAVVVPEGFGRVAATVTTDEGETCELCLWIADTGDLRSRGLMSVTDLGDADGMAFVYPEPHRGAFWMKDTVLPLSIAFFAPDGTHLDAFDMEPCSAEPCPHYPTPDGFTVAVEIVQGGLAGLGIGPGSTLRLSDTPCPA